MDYETELLEIDGIDELQSTRHAVGTVYADEFDLIESLTGLAARYAVARRLASETERRPVTASVVIDQNGGPARRMETLVPESFHAAAEPPVSITLYGEDAAKAIVARAIQEFYAA